MIFVLHQKKKKYIYIYNIMGLKWHEGELKMSFLGKLSL